MGDGWNVKFKIALGAVEEMQLERLMNLLENHNIELGEDEFYWMLEKSGKYSTRSMYRRMRFRRNVE